MTVEMLQQKLRIWARGSIMKHPLADEILIRIRELGEHLVEDFDTLQNEILQDVGSEMASQYAASASDVPGVLEKAGQDRPQDQFLEYLDEFEKSLGTGDATASGATASGAPSLVRLTIPKKSDEDVTQFKVLEPFMTRAREIYYTFGEISERQAIVTWRPRFHEGYYPRQSRTEPGKTFANAETNLPRKLKRINFLYFTVPANTGIADLYATFCNSINMRPTDYVNLYMASPTTVLVLWRKDDQRQCTLPDGWTFMERTTLSASGGSNPHSINVRLRSALLALECMTRITCMELAPLEDSDPMSILAVCRDKSRFELLVARLVAQMTPDKARSSFDRALVAGWGTIKELMEPLSNKLDKILYFVMDSRIPAITDYPNFSERGYDSFALEGEFYCVNEKKMVPCTLRQILTDPTHPAHYSRRSVVFMGETRDGKTELAKILARRLAAIHQRDTEMGQRKLIVVRGVEQLKSDELRSHMTTNVPVVFDDLMPGKCMHTSAEPTSFLKNLFEPVPGELYCRYVCAVLAAGPRFFTTNEGNLDKWLALRPDHGELTEAHKNAVLARAVFFRTQGRLYSEGQASSSTEHASSEHMLAMTELAKAKQLGF